jgi:hypothetical protein
MFHVLSTPLALDAMVRTLMPYATVVASGAGRAYRLYVASGGAINETYRDLHGSPLVALQSFDSEADAREWIRDDVHARMGESRAGSVHTPQNAWIH